MPHSFGCSLFSGHPRTPSRHHNQCVSVTRELRSGNKIDATELRLEDGLFKSFDEIVRRQLDSVWHTVSYKTKQVPTWSWRQLGFIVLELIISS